MSRRGKAAAVAEGGSWKGAFADFCMSMMTLFMVMWIVTNSDLEKKKALSLYFSDPGQFQTMSSKYAVGTFNSGMIINSEHGGRNALRVEDESSLVDTESNIGTLETELVKLGEGNDNLEVLQIPGGLKISLMESDGNPMFKSGEYLLTPFFEDLLLELTAKLKNSQYGMAIVGHTDGAPFHGTGFLNNWTLSFARANSVREIVDFADFPEEHILQVAGMADSDLKDEANPEAACNRRVDLILLDEEYADQAAGQTMVSKSMADAWKAAKLNQI